MRAASAASAGLPRIRRPHRDGGVGAEDRRRRQLARREPSLRGDELGLRHALDVRVGLLARLLGLESLDVLVGPASSGSWRTPSCSSSSRRRGLCEAR
jgi:hypothetical protein